MRIRGAAICGALLMCAGVMALIHPQFSYRVDQHHEQVAGKAVLFETRKVIRFPLWFSIPLIVIGAAMVVMGVQKD